MKYISYNDFSKIDIRIGKVTKAERIPGRRKILKLTVDLGEEKPRTIIAGGAEYYSPEYFEGKLFVVIANLEPKTIAGIKSEGMLLAADLNGKPVWLIVDGEVPPGTKVR
ncbi:MAG: tRNA-binding protein [Candidatus Methanomethylicota archaeon]|uniref:Methionine--tRNA ligase n=1 Tax=Thermoproteota archaeon TaxID=2056631 RepID=A0A497ETC3_9CREN|nr:MAG: tRNA-binding protein [Candidatus Verstraetearchaeota archaeon]